MNVNDGTIVLNTSTNYLAPSEPHLTLSLGNNGVLDMRDANKTINEITMMYLKSDNGTLHFDTDFANDLTDTIKASNGYNSEFKNLNLGSINVKSHFDGVAGTTKDIDIFICNLFGISECRGRVGYVLIGILRIYDCCFFLLARVGAYDVEVLSA